MNQSRPFILCLFSFILLFTLFTASCSSVNFIANEQFPLKVKVDQQSREEVVVAGLNEFYLWGKYPGFWDTNLLDEGKMKGLNFPTIVSIEQSIEWKNVFYSIITLGLYCPTDFKLTFSSVKLTEKESDNGINKY